MSEPLRFVRINNAIVPKMPRLIDDEDSRPVLGAHLFSENYCTIGLFAKPRSGKTNNIYYILSQCMGRDTIVIVFSRSFNNDPIWADIAEYVEKRGNTLIGFDSLLDGKENRLDQLVAYLVAEGKAKRLAKKLMQQPKPKKVIHTAEDKPLKPTWYQAPEYIIICDDLSKEMRTKSLEELIKNFRHFKAKVIISTQYFKDAAPGLLTMLDYFVLYKGIALKTLETVYDDAGLEMTFEQFLKRYKAATKLRYSFLLIDRPKDRLRVGFDKVLIPPNDI